MKNSNVFWALFLGVVLIGGALLLNNPSEAPTTVNEPELQHVHGMAVDVLDSNRLLIATHHGLLQLADGILSQVGTDADDLMGFTPHPTDAAIFFSSGHGAQGGNLGFQKSVDGGKTWTKVSNGINGPVDFHSMTVSAVNPNVLYGHFNGLQRSADGGSTWEWAKGTVQPYSLSSDPVREEVVYAATQNGVLVSEDHGDSWKSLSPQLEKGAVSVFAFDPEKKYALVFSQALEGLGRSVDGGLTWQKVSEDFDGATISLIAYSKTESLTVYAISQANGIYKSTDGGIVWIQVR